MSVKPSRTTAGGEQHPMAAASGGSDSVARTQLRIDGSRLVLRDDRFFENGAGAARRLIAQAFALDQVRAVALRVERGEIGIVLEPLADSRAVWRRLGALLTGGGASLGRAATLDLVGPTPGLPVRVSRAGDALTTFRARALARDHLRIGHPQLSDRRLRARFTALLRELHGVTDVRRVGLRSIVVVSFDPGLIDATRILAVAEGSWSEISVGGPPRAAPVRLAAAGGLLALSFTAQFFNPALLPWATAAVVAYSFPNLIGASRDLARGRVGLYALYATGLGFLLWTRLPFASSLMATFRQLWPTLAERLAASGERRLFAAHRRRFVTARVVDAQAGESMVGLDRLTPGARVVARAGEILPADGVVTEGCAIVDETRLGGSSGGRERSVGDFVYAGSTILDGALTLRVTRLGPDTSLAALGCALPRGALRGLPSSAAVERVANRNAQPALAAAAILLAATRAPRLSQVVIRPDFVTAPRLSAHLSGLAGVAEALGRGLLIRRPSALDLLASAEVFAIDAGVNLHARALSVKRVNVLRRVDGLDVLQLAHAALTDGDPRRRALKRELDELEAREGGAYERRRRVGATRFLDGTGAAVSVTAPSRALALLSAADISPQFRMRLEGLRDDPVPDPAMQPLVVFREGRLVGLVQFAREGVSQFGETIAALRLQYPQARFVHLAEGAQDAVEDAVDGLGFDAVFGELDPNGKAEAIRSLGLRTVWLGDGADRKTALARTASMVSVSLAGLERLSEDEADVTLLRDDVTSLPGLCAVVKAHKARLRNDYRTVYAANLLGVAGGFAAGLNSLDVGLLSNLGAAAVLLRRWRTLAGLAKQKVDWEVLPDR